MPPFKKKDKKKKKKSGKNQPIDKYYGEAVDEDEMRKSKKRLRAPVGASRLEPFVKKVRQPRAPSPTHSPPHSPTYNEATSDSDSDASVELDAAPSLELLTKTSKKSIYSDSEEDSDDEEESDSESDSDSKSKSNSRAKPAPLPTNQPNPFFHAFPSSPPPLSKSSAQSSNTQTSILSASPPPVDLNSAISSFADALVTGGKRQNEDAVVGHILSHVDNVITVISKNDKKASDPPRDQGYFRSTVLVLLPTRGVALDYINVLLDKADTGNTPKESYVLNYERFEKEFSLDSSSVDDEDVKKARKKGKQFMKVRN
jgi:hypothetical protein